MSSLAFDFEYVYHLLPSPLQEDTKVLIKYESIHAVDICVTLFSANARRKSRKLQISPKNI